MKFSELVEKKRKGTLTDDEKSIYKKLIRSYNKIEIEGKENFSIQEVEKIKNLRAEYSPLNTRASKRLEPVLSAMAAYEEGNEKVERFNEVVKQYTQPKTRTLAQDERAYYALDRDKISYADYLESRVNELKGYLSNKNYSSVAYKQFMRSNPSTRELGLARTLARDQGMLILDKNTLKEIGTAMQIIREQSELAGIKNYKDLWLSADSSIDLRNIGRDYLSGEDNAEVLSQVYNLVNRLK